MSVNYVILCLYPYNFTEKAQNNIPEDPVYTVVHGIISMKHFSAFIFIGASYFQHVNLFILNINLR